MEAALPEAYENGAEWYMSKNTFYNQIVGMTDSNGQPIARTNVGIDGRPEHTILGRKVNFCQYVPSWTASVEEDTTIAFIFNMEDYMLNTNLNVTVKKYEDHETDDQMTKAIMLADGKVIDTILFNLAKGMEGLGQVATVGMMYVIQTLINLVIPSGSAKAALTMPIMAPFSELIGLSKQATVMAFQFGDGFTNLITPTSGVLIAVLGVSRIPYDKWFKWAWKFILVLVILGFLLLIPTVLIPMNGF